MHPSYRIDCSSLEQTRDYPGGHVDDLLHVPPLKNTFSQLLRRCYVTVCILYDIICQCCYTLLYLQRKTIPNLRA